MAETVQWKERIIIMANIKTCKTNENQLKHLHGGYSFSTLPGKQCSELDTQGLVKIPL